MNAVNTSRVLIQDAMSLCSEIIQMLESSKKGLQYKYKNAGSNWTDLKYQQLGDIINECCKTIERTLRELNNCIIPLKELKQSIEDYEGVNIAGISSGIENTTHTIPIGVGITGGSYKNCKMFSDGKTEQVHHMPAASVSYLEYKEGSAIIMKTEDHEETASYDNKPGSREYRKKQSFLIEQGRFSKALQMDIDDIHFKFKNKYDNAINAALEYVNQLRTEGRIR